MMNTAGRLLLLGWLSSLLACQKDIAVEIAPQSPRLVVYGMLQPDSLVAVWITSAATITDNRLPIEGVGNATVMITPDGQPPQELTLLDAQLGKYQADFWPEPGATYHLSITAEGYPPVEAITQVPRPVSVEQVSYEAQSIPNPSTCGGCPDSIVDYRIALTFTDPVSEENYYEIAGWVEYLRERYVYDTITEQLDTVRFIAVDQLHLRSADPAVGSIEETITDNEPGRYFYYNLPFTDQRFDGERYTFGFRTVNSETPTSTKIAFRTYHEEAYRYERAKDEQRSYAFDALLYEPVQLPMNIRGGYGIFSSFSQDTVVIELE